MNESLGHKVLASIREYVDFRLLKDLRAYTTITGKLYEYNDQVLNKVAYGSPYGSWCYNSGYTGVVVPTGIGVYGRGSGGLSIDFLNGRVLFNSGITGLNITGIYSVPNINSYITTYSHMNLINQTNFQVSPTYKTANTYMKPYSAVLPAIFYRLSDTNNEPYAFGGQENTEYNISITALINNPRYLVGLSDVFRDLQDRILPIMDSTPLNEYGDLKDSTWNYNYYLTGNIDYMMVDESYLKFIENDNFTERNNNVYMAVGNVKITTPRFPRSEFP